MALPDLISHPSQEGEDVEATYIYISCIYIYLDVYPCGIVLDVFAEHGISESWTNQ